MMLSQRLPEKKVGDLESGDAPGARSRQRMRKLVTARATEIWQEFRASMQARVRSAVHGLDNLEGVPLSALSDTSG